MNIFDTSEYKITYLLGAGASAKALPTVKKTETNNGFSNSLKEFGKNLEVDKVNKILNPDNLKNIITDINWLAENSFKFGTPDTFAKYLYLEDKKNLIRLKNILSFYFTVEQFYNKRFDDRALIFLTTVMKVSKIFPTNIKILNWNYDFQIQLAGEVFVKETFTFDKSGATVHSPSLVNYYPTLGHEMHVNNHSRNLMDISMVHLNGIANLFYEMPTTYIQSTTTSDINEIINREIYERDKKHTLMTFAWENETMDSNILRKRMEIATTIIKDTDILIIVGYSFPFFNREVDKQIFEAIKISGKLKKIIYQDPYKTGEFLRKQFNLSEDIEIVHVEETDNYFVPNEL